MCVYIYVLPFVFFFSLSERKTYQTLQRNGYFILIFPQNRILLHRMGTPISCTYAVIKQIKPRRATINCQSKSRDLNKFTSVCTCRINFTLLLDCLLPLSLSLSYYSSLSILNSLFPFALITRSLYTQFCRNSLYNSISISSYQQPSPLPLSLNNQKIYIKTISLSSY